MFCSTVQERGQVMACINLLGLNNELYCSHLQLKLQILEMGVQASLSDLRDLGQTMALSVQAENAAQLMRWIYDLIVLDPNEDTSKKTSVKVRHLWCSEANFCSWRFRFSPRAVNDGEVALAEILYLPVFILRMSCNKCVIIPVCLYSKTVSWDVIFLNWLSCLFVYFMMLFSC